MQERFILQKVDKVCRKLINCVGQAKAINEAVGKMDNFNLTSQGCWKKLGTPPPTRSDFGYLILTNSPDGKGN